MEFKKMIILLTVTVSIMFGVLLGVSYGWYAYANAESNIKSSTIKKAPTIVFAQTEFISVSQNPPIYDEDRYKYANKNSFTVTLGENLTDYETGVEIFLKQINMSKELKIDTYKYELLQNNKIVSSGNFSNLGDSTTLKILPMTILEPTTYPTTYLYELYVWLSEDESNQNYLMDKNFGAKIEINSAVKK